MFLLNKTEEKMKTLTINRKYKEKIKMYVFLSIKKEIHMFKYKMLFKYRYQSFEIITNERMIPTTTKKEYNLKKQVLKYLKELKLYFNEDEDEYRRMCIYNYDTIVKKLSYYNYRYKTEYSVMLLSVFLPLDLQSYLLRYLI